MSEATALMIHGGAGAIFDKTAYAPSIEQILNTGHEMLRSGSAALDVVEHCAMMLEDDPLFNAGRGAVLNSAGEVELDAALMNGGDLSAGAVAGVKYVKNPTQLARLVKERTEHVMLIGEGARIFADRCGVEQTDAEYFITDHRRKQWREVKANEGVALDHSAPERETRERKFGTIGAVARDAHGDLAAATSTGGLVNNKHGRVGDSPIIGAGVYADNRTCAVSTTGYGEGFMRAVTSKTIADHIAYTDCNAQQAAEYGITRLTEDVNGLGAAIVIDNAGNLGVSFSSKELIGGSITAANGLNVF